MNSSGSSRTETIDTLQKMVAEAKELQAAVGGSVTDAVAGWLAPQYLLAAQSRLADANGNARFGVLRTVVQDWAMLRRGDHMAERLQLERARLKLAERDAQKKWEPKLEAGIDELGQFIHNNPEALAIYHQLSRLVRAEEKPKSEKEFWERLKQPEIRKAVLSELTQGLSAETRAKIEKELNLI